MIITRNIVGLARFLFVIFSPPKRVKKQSSKENQLKKLIGPTVSLTEAKPIFCSKCHSLVCWEGKENGDKVVVDNHKNVIRISNITIIGKNGEREGFPMRCPNGHEVLLKCKA